MKVGAVQLKEIAKSGRLDAPFHLARIEHRAAVNRLLRLGRARLDEVLMIIPGTLAGKLAVARGRADGLAGFETWKPGRGYSDLEVAVYIACSIAGADESLRVTRRKLLDDAIIIETARERLREILA